MSFGINMLVVLVCTICRMWGPGKALRGQDGSSLEETCILLERTMYSPR